MCFSCESILAYCVVQRFHISEQVLIPLHRSYLLRNAGPLENDKYWDDELLKDAKDSLGNEKEPVEYVLAGLSDETRRLTKFEKFEKFRKMLSEIYIENRSFALDSIKEGLTFNGR